MLYMDERGRLRDHKGRFAALVIQPDETCPNGCERYGDWWVPVAVADDRCGVQFAQHPTKPNLVAVCTKPLGHEGPHDNLLPKTGPS